MMDYEEFLKRLNLQAISKFLLYGGDASSIVSGTLNERLDTSRARYTECLSEFDEELAGKLFVDIGSSEDAYFELGVIAGFMLSKELLKKLF